MIEYEYRRVPVFTIDGEDPLNDAAKKGWRVVPGISMPASTYQGKTVMSVLLERRVTPIGTPIEEMINDLREIVERTQ